MSIEWIKFGRPSVVGMVTGTIAGLATITPASGFVGPQGALVLGVAGAVICFYSIQFVKFKLKIDDSLDVFAVHGVGGILDSLLVAFLAVESWGGAGLNVDGGSIDQFLVQLCGVAATIVWSVIASAVILFVIKLFGGLRVSEEDEYNGLDVSSHGEHAYDL